jgi:hypothetical protein
MMKELVRGERDYVLELSDGKIYFNDPGFLELISKVLESDGGAYPSSFSEELMKIGELNEQLRMQDLDDPEPVEEELLSRCDEFLKKYDK